MHDLMNCWMNVLWIVSFGWMSEGTCANREQGTTACSSTSKEACVS